MHILRTTSGLLVIAIVALSAVGQTTVRGQCRIHTIRTADDDGEVFGPVAADGDYAVMRRTGFRLDVDEERVDYGRVVVLKRFGHEWVQQAMLIDDGGGQDGFGEAVAINGDVIVVGAKRDDDACPEDNGCNSGSAYVFRRVAGAIWIREAKLLASDITEGSRFGTSVAVEGDTIVVGAPSARVNSGQVFDGAAYVFKRQGLTWVEEAKLTGSPGASDSHTGSSVAISGGRVLIGAESEDLFPNGPTSGSQGEWHVTASGGTLRFTTGFTVNDANDGDFLISNGTLAIDDDVEYHGGLRQSGGIIRGGSGATLEVSGSYTDS